MEILIINDYKTVYDREFAMRDYIKFTSRSLLIALTIISLSSKLVTAAPIVSQVLAVDKVKCLMNESIAWTILRLSEVANHKELMGTFFSDLAKNSFELTKYFIELGIEAFKSEGETSLLLLRSPNQKVADVIFLRSLLKTFGIF